MVQLTILIITLVFVSDVWGYLDPGTGSYFFQILIGVLAGIGFSLKLFWKKIITFITSNSKRNCSDEKPE
ncbi:MAG: hypothetical protein JW915_04955 [Chitinispirillaceae bacterium]|nr:hypothetical protein [Chitinispirillaceae bacterium]